MVGCLEAQGLFTPGLTLMVAYYKRNGSSTGVSTDPHSPLRSARPEAGARGAQLDVRLAQPKIGL